MISEGGLEHLIHDHEKYFAHKRISDKGEIVRETLGKHVELTEKYFNILWENKQGDRMLKIFLNKMFGEFSKAAEGFLRKMIGGLPLFHDTGKINPGAQNNNMDNMEIEDDGRLTSCINSRHSLISAILYIDYYLQRLKIEVKKKKERKLLRLLILIHGYLIARHHSDLYDFNKFLSDLSQGSGKELMGYFRDGMISAYKPKFVLQVGDIQLIQRDAFGMRQSFSWVAEIYLYTYARLMYSLLVASDYYATTEFSTGKEITDFGNLDDIQEWVKVYENTELIQSIRKYQKEQYPKSPEALKNERNINVLRTEMLCDAEKMLEDYINSLFFYLESPTGSGKSNTALDLSLRLINANMGLQKIYYIYPFNTLIEQNIKNLKKIFGNNDKIFSNIAVVNSLTPIKKTEAAKKTEEETEQSYYYQKALLDRQFLNYPVILSTHVSLFDTMFNSAKESAFAFHQLMNSVIVLDEIQSYNNKIWGEIAYFLKAFAELLNMKVIIMSATLPDFDLLTDGIYPTVRLMKNGKKYFNHPCFARRVTLSYELLDATAGRERDEVFEILEKHIQKFVPEKKKILVEFITKESAFLFFQKLKEDETIPCDIEYMSGDDSIAERSRILEKIANAQNGIILVATQVIEAGVDMDMDIGFKNISKLDSEEQFLGRINRSCLKNGLVYFFELDNWQKIYREDVRLRKEFTLENREIQDILQNKDFQKYYEKILAELKKNRNENTGELGLDDFFHRKVGALKWPDVRERMKLIPDNHQIMEVYLSRKLQDENGQMMDGQKIWTEYKELIQNVTMSYAQKRVRLSEVRSQMNYFVYQIKQNPDLNYNDKIGELICIDNGEKYFIDGKLDRKKLQGEVGDFVDFI